MPRPSPFSSMRTPTPREVATEQAFRAQERAKRKAEAKDTPVWPTPEGKLGKKKKAKKRLTVEEERPVAAAIHLKYRIKELRDSIARSDPKDAEEMYGEDLELIEAIIPGLRDEPENDTYLSDFRSLQKKYQRAG